MAIKGGEIITEYKSDTRDLERGARRAEQITQQSAQRINATMNRMGGSGGILPGLGHISEIIQGIPQVGRLIGGLVSPFISAAQAGIQFNMTLENALIGFEGVAGGADNALKHVNALQAFAEKTPFEFTGLLRSSRYMSTFGFAIDEQIPKLKSWGNAVAASGDLSEETLLGVVRAFGQMRSLGRVNSEEMNQLAERGIPAWELLAKAIGKTVEQTRKLGERGMLKGGAAVEAITAMMDQDPRFKGQMDRMSGTLSGRLSNLEDIRARGLGLATQNVTKDLNESLGGALSQANLAEQIAGNVNTALGPVSGLIRASVISMTTDGLGGGFKEAFDLAKTYLPTLATSMVDVGILAPMFKAAGVQSPSVHTYYIGQMLAAGLNNGLRDGLRDGRLSEEIEKIIAEAAAKYGLDPKLIRAVIRKESRGNPRAVSPVGARGAMQIMPDTGRALGLRPDEFFNPQKNIMAGSRYLRQQLDRFDGREDLALAAYNWGPHRKTLDKALGTGQPVTDFKIPAETRNYVQQISQELKRVRGMADLPMPMPVRVVGGDGGVARPFTDDMARHVEGLGFGGGGLPTSKSFGGLSLLQPGSAAADSNLGFRADPVQAQMAWLKLLDAISKLGPTADASFKQAEAAAGSFYDRVVSTGEKVSFLGITAEDAGDAFRSSWLSATTDVEGGLLEMLQRIPLHFAQSLNQMVQSWAASQLSSALNSLIKIGLGAITGSALPSSGTNLGGIGSLSPGFAGKGFASGTMSAPAGFAVVGEAGRELVKLKGGERIYNNRETEKMLGTTVINNNRTTVINYTPRNTPDSYGTRRSGRESFEQLLAMAK
jgi:tape measure domain-containing protein